MALENAVHDLVTWVKKTPAVSFEPEQTDLSCEDQALGSDRSSLLNLT